MPTPIRSSPRTIIAGTAMLACVLAGPPVSAGVVRGVLHVPPTDAAAERVTDAYPGRASSMAGMHGPTRGAATDAIVYFERIPREADSLLRAAGPRPRLAQKDQCFAPRVLVVATGTTVDFPNMDPIYHNVFSLSPVKRFDLGKYPKGQSRPVTFDRAGLVNVFCDIHSNMAAYVLVLPHHGFTQPDAAGAWTLPEVPPGNYVVKVWHPDFQPLTRDVRVPEHGDVSLDLSEAR